MNHRPMRYFTALELGPPGELTSLAVIERPYVHPSHPPAQRRPKLNLIHLHRFTLGTPYPEIVEIVVQLLRTPPLPGATLAIDWTGVGRSVLQYCIDSLVRCVTGRIVPVTIGLGLQAERVPGTGVLVPRQELVGTLQVLMQTRRIGFPRSMPLVETLVEELGSFKAKPVTLSAAAKADPVALWREGQHDDLVLAVALAAWMSEMSLPRLHEPIQTPARR